MTGFFSLYLAITSGHSSLALPAKSARKALAIASPAIAAVAAQCTLASLLRMTLNSRTSDE